MHREEGLSGRATNCLRLTQCSKNRIYWQDPGPRKGSPLKKTSGPRPYPLAIKTKPCLLYTRAAPVQHPPRTLTPNLRRT